MVTAMAPLFISSATNAALAQEISSRCAGNVNGALDNYAPIAESEPAIARASSQTTTLGQPILTRPTPPVQIVTTGADTRKLLVRFLHRTGYEDNVEVLEQSDPGGLWITDRGADYLGLMAGDDIEIVDGRGNLVTIPVGTVYRDLNETPRTDYWCPVQDYFIPGPPHGDLPPALVLIDANLFRELFPNLESPPYGGVWEFPVERADLTTQTAAAAIQQMEQMESDINQSLTSGFPRVVTIRTDLPFIVRRSAALGEVLRSSVVPIAAVAVVSALGLLAAAGSYWVDRRRTEVVLLITKGIGPGAIALKAAVEMAGAVVIGTVLGWLLALAAGPAVGPSPLIDSSTRWQTLIYAIVAGGVGLVAVGIIVGVRSARILDLKRRRWTTSFRIPALLGFAAAAGLAWFSLRNGAITVAQGDQAGRVGPLVLAFPLFLFGAAILLAAEVLARMIGRERPVRQSRSPALFLASRRIASSPMMALVLIAAAALPVATLVYAANLSRSSSSTIEAKAASFIGSDLAVAMASDRPMPVSLAGSATQVTRYERVLVGDQEVDIIGVDPTTFRDGAYWHDSFAEASLEEILSLLESPDPDGSLTVVVANGSIIGSMVESGRWDEVEIPVRVAATIDSFPGMRGSRPLLIADNAALSNWTTLENDGRLPGFRDWVYVRDTTEPDAVGAFRDEGVTFAWINSTDDVLDQLKYAVIIWTFDFVEIIAVLAALIVVAGVFLYGDARQRARNLSYALARRMGLSRRSHFVAAFLELLVLLSLGLAVGAVSAIAASALVYGGIDPVPTTPPAPRLILAFDVVAAAAVATLAVAAAGALLSQRIADGADTSELLRHGE
jgi:putative ABC transport system permease protein